MINGNDLLIVDDNGFPPLTSKYRSRAREDIWREPAARNGITESKCAQGSACRPTFILVTVNIEKRTVIFVQGQPVPFQAHAEVAMKKVFRINTAAPSMVYTEITIIPPSIASENLSSPQANVPLCIPIPLRTRRLLDRCLFHLPARRVGLSSPKREKREQRQGTQRNCKFLYHFSLV